MKNRSENAKNRDWKGSPDLPSVKPEDYDTSIDSARGSAHKPEKQVVTPGNNPDKYLSKQDQKKRRQLPLHDEKIGGG